MADIDFTMKTDATGTVLTFWLSDEDGRVDLSSYSFVKVTLRQDDIAAAISAATCTVDADQTTNKGKCTYAFGSAATGLPPGEYNLEFWGRDGSGKDHYWPTDSTEVYGKVLVEPHL